MNPYTSAPTAAQQMKEVQDSLVVGSFVYRQLVGFFRVEHLRDRLEMELPRGWREGTNHEGISLEARLGENNIPYLVVKFKGSLDVARIRELDPFYRGPAEGKVACETERAFRIDFGWRRIMLVDYEQVPRLTWSDKPLQYYYRAVEVNSDWFNHFSAYFDWLGAVCGKAVNRTYRHPREDIAAAGGITQMPKDDDFRFQIGMRSVAH